MVDSPRQTAAELRKAAETGTTSGSSSSNKDAAANLRAMLKGGKEESPDSKKRKHEGSDSESDDEPLDEVRNKGGWEGVLVGLGNVLQQRLFLSDNEMDFLT